MSILKEQIEAELGVAYFAGMNKESYLVTSSTKTVLALIRQEIEKIENPYYSKERLDITEEVFEQARQAILERLK